MRDPQSIRPFDLVTASRSTLPSAAEPFHPVNTNMKFIFLLHTPSTFMAISPFRDLYLGFASSPQFTLIYVPSNAPKQPYT